MAALALLGRTAQGICETTLQESRSIVYNKMNEIAVFTSDGRIIIEQNLIDGQMGQTNEIVIDAFQVPLLSAWLEEAAVEIEANREP